MRCGSLKSDTGVAELDADALTLGEDAHVQRSGRPGVHDGIDGIVEDVEEDLLKLVRVSGDEGDIRIIVLLDPDAVELEIEFTQGHGVFQHAT